LYTKKRYNSTMRVQLFIWLVLASLLLTSCTTQPTRTLSPETASQPSPEDFVAFTTESALEIVCPGDEINPLGQSIADEYEFTNYAQVMTWFCDGAEFEDILVALETQAATDTPAGDMLQMLADGMSWDDIWQQVGLED
jgi:hypothetical protein